MIIKLIKTMTRIAENLIFIGLLAILPDAVLERFGLYEFMYRIIEKRRGDENERDYYYEQ